ncbi:MAG: DUF3168 domain-containing protein [Lachnospiraceae bacterium]|nr:DUF3168 domain-containing protein [Lachnospiraceae bacterium]
MTSNGLRILVKSTLLSACQRVFYKKADKDAMYPHVVFELKKSRKYDTARDDVTIDVDIWTKADGCGTDVSEVEAFNIADAIEGAFNNRNSPQETFLPTFFVENIQEIEDADKDITHIAVEITAQNYERS